MHGFTFYFCTSFIICLLVCWCILIDISICNEYKQGDKLPDEKLKAYREFGTHGIILSVISFQTKWPFTLVVYITKEITAHVGFSSYTWTKHGDNKRFYLSAATVDRRSLSSDKIMEEENGHWTNTYLFKHTIVRRK